MDGSLLVYVDRMDRVDGKDIVDRETLLRIVFTNLSMNSQSSFPRLDWTMPAQKAAPLQWPAPNGSLMRRMEGRIEEFLKTIQNLAAYQKFLMLSR